MEQESRVNNPKPWIAQLFCRHHGEWFRRQAYQVCPEAGRPKMLSNHEPRRTPEEAAAQDKR